MGMRDAHEFDAFYAATGARLVAQIYAMIGNRAEAEDAVAEAYARAWQRWGVVSDYAEPVAWVRAVAYRIAVNAWRRALNRRAAHARLGDAASVAEPSADSVALVHALRDLPAAQRRAIVLHHMAGLSVQEVAQETGASPSAVKARLARGRRALAALLGNDEEMQCTTT
jgi:RNA polymerase sigma-70 factor (sigma-E family)